MRIHPANLILAAIVVALAMLLASAASGYALNRDNVGELGADLGSFIKADYSADPDGIRIAPLSEGVGEDARNDEENLTQEDGPGDQIVSIVPISRIDPDPPAAVANPATPSPRPLVSPPVAPTATATPAPTDAPTLAPTVAPTAPPTNAPTPLRTLAPTPTIASTPTPTLAPVTDSPTPVPTVTRTATPTPTRSPVATVSPTPTPTETPATTPTASPVATAPSVSPSASPTASSSPTPTVSPTPTATPTNSPSPTPTVTPTVTPTAIATIAPTPTITATAALTPVATPTQTATPTPTPTPVPTRSPAPTAATVSYLASADSYVRGSGESNKNFGNDKELKVNADGANSRQAFLVFDLSGIPVGATVVAAVLTVCTSNLPSGAPGHVHQVHRVTGPWAETGITWDTQPPAVLTASASIALVAGMTCLSFDVGGDAQLWLNGNPNYGWRLADSGESVNNVEVRYAARENNDTAITPRLTVTFTP